MTRPAPGTLAIAVARSGNAKIGGAATTYAAQTSCPSSCVFFDGGGCYAEAGTTGKFVTAPLNATAGEVAHTAEDVARAEAAMIDGLPADGWPLRLHTVGDCKTDEAARIVSEAAVRYMERGGGPVWTYTHAWREVARESWGEVSVLASCETPEDLADAAERGYAGSIVVAEFPSRRRFSLDGFDVVPCPAQTSGATCASCGLCFADYGLIARGTAIGFEVHGNDLTVKKARLALEDPDDPGRRLTSRDHAVAFRAELGRWPTTRELMDRARVNKESAYQMLGKLRAA